MWLIYCSACCLFALQNLGLESVGVKMTKNGAIEVYFHVLFPFSFLDCFPLLIVIVVVG